MQLDAKARVEGALRHALAVHFENARRCEATHQRPAHVLRVGTRTRREQQRFAMRDRCCELEFGVELRGRGEELARRRQLSQRAVDGIEQMPAAAPREPVARQRHQFGDAPDTDRLQHLRRARIAVECRERQGRDGRFERALAVDDFLEAGTREQ